MSSQKPNRRQPESPEEQARSTIQEARMVLPGIQALFGFRLIAAFDQRFIELGLADRVVHLASLVLVAVANALIMTPAAYHRIVEPGLRGSCRATTRCCARESGHRSRRRVRHQCEAMRSRRDRATLTRPRAASIAAL